MMMDYGMNAWGVVSTIMNLLLGGGFLITFLTLKAQRKRIGAEARGAEATAKGSEIDNAESVIALWRELTEKLVMDLKESRENFNSLGLQVEALRKDVQRLNSISNRILKMLDKINHENLDKMVEAIKEEIQKSNA